MLYNSLLYPYASKITAFKSLVYGKIVKCEIYDIIY